jgi:uncharacterized membrane protein
MMLALLLLGCSESEDSGGSTVDCVTAPEADWDGFAHGFMLTYCVSCHSVHNTDARYGAPEGLNFDTEAEVYEMAARIRARTLDDQTMPPGGGVFEDDLLLLDLSRTCQPGT